jgi:signal peptidase I
MEPTMMVNDKILVQKLSYWTGAPKHGDIVVFDDPGGWLSPEEQSTNPVRRFLSIIGLAPTGGHLIKRVVGVGGDRIAVRDGHVIRNGKLQSEPFTAPCAGGQGCDLPRSITIPQGYVFCMGDNRGASDDGRFWGPIPVNWVIGGAFATYWPPKRIGTL